MTSRGQKVVATIEARTGSTRLPGKVLAMIQDKSLLELIIERSRGAKSVDEVVVATTLVAADDPIEALAIGAGVEYFRGSTDDIMGRVLRAARSVSADVIVGLTGDNPLIDPVLIDDVVTYYVDGGYDYVTTTHMHHSLKWGAKRSFPVGVSVQVFATELLARVESETADLVDREHLSFRIYDQPERFRLGAFQAEGKYAAWREPELRLTVDVPEDLALMREIFGRLYVEDHLFSTATAIRLVAGNPALRSINQHVPQRLAHQERMRSYG